MNWRDIVFSFLNWVTLLILLPFICVLSVGFGIYYCLDAGIKWLMKITRTKQSRGRFYKKWENEL